MVNFQPPCRVFFFFFCIIDSGEPCICLLSADQQVLGKGYHNTFWGSGHISCSLLLWNRQENFLLAKFYQFVMLKYNLYEIDL